MNHEKLTTELSHLLLANNWKLATAESCTGGGVAFALTALPGSSAWFERGFVTYSNSAKTELLGVKPATLLKHGAVSEQTAYEMAEGALNHSQAHISIAITGIAGPSGGSPEKPVGTVWLACSGKNQSTQTSLLLFTGNREIIRTQAIQAALEKIIEFIRTN